MVDRRPKEPPVESSATVPNRKPESATNRPPPCTLFPPRLWLPQIHMICQGGRHPCTAPSLLRRLRATTRRLNTVRWNLGFFCVAPAPPKNPSPCWQTLTLQLRKVNGRYLRKMDGKRVQPDDQESVITQAEHRIRMAVQRDAD